LNTQHPNIKFTIEKSTKTLQFLDVDIRINESSVDTWVWRKPTNTGLCLNFEAICPLKWKSALILCMLHRAKSICSNDILFFAEVNKLKSIFMANNYTGRFFDKILRRFLTSCSDARTGEKVNDELPSDKYFLKVPYVGLESKRFVNRLSDLLHRRYGKLIAIFS